MMVRVTGWGGLLQGRSRVPGFRRHRMQRHVDAARDSRGVPDWKCFSFADLLTVG